jgi:mannose-6-phosphate isomerase-like protein (cupin superfamily)
MAAKQYAKYVFSDFREEANLPAVATPQAYFRGARQIPGATMNMGWQLFVRPFQLEKEPHTHKSDEYLIFLGGQLPDLFSSFEAEIDFWLGEEMEQYLITRPTIIYIPAGLQHCPLNLRKIVKPVLFSALLLTPKFTKTMNGKEYSYDGPNIGGAGPMITV